MVHLQVDWKFMLIKNRDLAKRHLQNLKYMKVCEMVIVLDSSLLFTWIGGKR